MNLPPAQDPWAGQDGGIPDAAPPSYSPAAVPAGPPPTMIQPAAGQSPWTQAGQPPVAGQPPWAGPGPASVPSRWKTWHKAVLSVVGVLALGLSALAIFAHGTKPGAGRAAAPISSTPPSSPTQTAATAANPAQPPAGTSAATSKPAATPATVEPVHYADCDALLAEHSSGLRRGEAGYREQLDRDGDGTACEPNGDDDPGSDPQFSTCAKAKAAGYGPYEKGDPEYSWYQDRDNDGVVCE